MAYSRHSGTRLLAISRIPAAVQNKLVLRFNAYNFNKDVSVPQKDKDCIGCVKNQEHPYL